MFYGYSILNIFSLSSAEVLAYLAAAILFCSKHNNVISIQGQLLWLRNYFKIQLLQIFYKLTECRFCIQYEMSIWVGEASAINSNISSHQMDTKVYQYIGQPHITFKPIKVWLFSPRENKNVSFWFGDRFFLTLIHVLVFLLFYTQKKPVYLVI